MPTLAPKNIPSRQAGQGACGQLPGRGRFLGKGRRKIDWRCLEVSRQKKAIFFVDRGGQGA